jgi:formamidopyrimidine-DNA glycosylase
MPELPEVETMCRCIGAAVGCRIGDIQRPKSRLQSIIIRPPLGEFRRRAVGKTIAAVRRVGKRVVLVLAKGETGESGDCIVLEPRMTGLVLLADPPDREHLRLVFRLSAGRAKRILFWDQRGLGVARLVSHEQFVRCYGPDQLGPDALTISVDTLRQRLGGSRRAIKVALLDQHALAGVGNLYASEILHLARINPATLCRRLRPAQWARLHAAMGTVLRAAIRHQGSTLRDGTYRIARNRGGDYQVYHRVYQRTGEKCLQCGVGQIVRIVQAQRSTFFCPACQPSCSSRRRR